VQLLEKEQQPSKTEPCESSKKPRQLTDNSFLPSGPAKELRNGARAGQNAWKSTSAARPGEGSNRKRKGKTVEQAGKAKKGPNYNTQKGATAGVRVSLGAQDLVDASSMMRLESGQQPYQSLGGGPSQIGSPPGEAASASLAPGIRAKPRAAHSIAEVEAAPLDNSPLPDFISGHAEPPNLLYAPILSTTGAAKASVLRAVEAVNEYGGAQLREVSEASPNHLPELAPYNARAQRALPLAPQTLAGHPKLKNSESSSTHMLASLKDSAKRPRPKFSQFADQYEKVTAQAREITKQRKPGGKLHEDYKKALKVLGEMQQSIERGPTQGAYCPNLQPYLSSIAAPLVPSSRDRGGAPLSKESRERSVRSLKSLNKVASAGSLGQAAPSMPPKVPPGVE